MAPKSAVSVYRSKIDGWLLVALGAAMAITAYGVVDMLWHAPEQWGSALAGALIGLVLPLSILLGTRYVIDHGQRLLRVRCGPFRWRIPIASITSISPCLSLQSNPALSIERLRIDYRPNRSLLVSPRHQERFVAEIEALRQGG